LGQVIRISRGDYSLGLVSNTNFTGASAALAAENFAAVVNASVIAVVQLGVQALYTGGN
jgi:flagellar basal body L-ring protein FlgH